LVEQLVPCQRGLAMLDEVSEQEKLTRREVNRLSRTNDLGLAKVHRDVPELVTRWAPALAGRGAPQLRLDARGQLRHVERLRQVVVGAQFQPAPPAHDPPP